MWHRLLMFGLVFVCGCGSIPTAPNADLTDTELVYVNDTWGFQVSRPTSDWGLSAQTFLQQVYPNGLPVVEVHIASPLNETLGAAFRPEFFLEPRAGSTGVDIDALANAFEESELKVLFEGYEAQGDKQKTQLSQGELVQWQFRNSPFSAQSNRFPGTRFMAGIAVHKDQFYIMVGNGSNNTGFPIDDYRLIAESLRFPVGN